MLVQITSPDIETCVGVIHVIDAVITRTDDGSSSLAPDAGSLVSADADAAGAAAGPAADAPAADGAVEETGGDGSTTATARDAGDAVADDDASRAGGHGGLDAALGTLAAVVVAAVVA